MRSQSYSTRFVNVSESGMAFVVDRQSSPRIGEIIKVEFPIPGGESVAWFARVVRLEDYGLTKVWGDDQDFPEELGEVLVGISFYNLPDGHRQAIRGHLHDKFQEVVRERRLALLKRLSEFFKDNGFKLIIYAVTTLLTASILYYLSRPGPNYDANRGSPWGQRFK